MKQKAALLAAVVVSSFVAGFFSHALYRRWTGPPIENRAHAVTYAPASPPAESPVVAARDVEKLRALSGRHARVRGTVYRVGYSTRSNTHFLNFGPARSAFTAVIFASALPAFEKNLIQPKGYEGKDVELSGVIRDHPQYGVEMILEDPSQIKVLK